MGEIKIYTSEFQNILRNYFEQLYVTKYENLESWINSKKITIFQVLKRKK